MCASVNVPSNGEPRWPLVPKLTSCDVGRLRLAFVVLALESRQVDQQFLRGRLAGQGGNGDRAITSERGAQRD